VPCRCVIWAPQTEQREAARLDEGDNKPGVGESVECRVSSVKLVIIGEGGGGRADLDQGPADLGPATCTGQLSRPLLTFKIRSYNLSVRHVFGEKGCAAHPVWRQGQGSLATLCSALLG
jgi:hypothetical protein